MERGRRNSYLAIRPTLLGVAKLIVLSLGQLPFAHAAPIGISTLLRIQEEEGGKTAGDPSLWLYLGVAAALVLLGGAFAGLTIALMGQVSVLKTERSDLLLTQNRMRYIFKSSENLVKERKRNMLRRCWDFSTEANTGSWLHSC